MSTALLRRVGAFGLVLAAACTEPPPGEPIRIRDVTRELLQGPVFWETRSARDDAPPEVGVISPAIHFSRDGAGMPSLILAPPAEVRFTVQGPDVPATLRARAGIDISSLKYVSAGHPHIDVEFEVLVNDASVFDARVRLEKVVGEPVGTSWIDVGGEAGLALRPGDVVTLRTFGIDLDGARFVPPVPLFAGFGGLGLERAYERARTRSSASAPNVVLVVMDTLRVDRLSAYGYGRPTSPRLAELAARGTLYESAWSTSSWTWPATASLLTGLQPQEHGVLDKGSCYLSSELTTVAESLQRAGFTTAAWSGNPLVSPLRNFGQGFEDFDSAESFRKTGEFFDGIEAWLRARGDTRFFLYLHLVEPHAPYVALPDGKARLAPAVAAELAEHYGEDSRALLDGAGHGPDGALRTEDVVSAEHQRGYSDLYDACVWSGDSWFGRVLDLLAELELADETIVIFTNDHGEELFDRGLMNHGQSLHPELTRAPLVLAGPGIEVGRRERAPVSTRHIAPTIARLAGVDPGYIEGALDLSKPPPPNPDPVLFSTENGWWNGVPGRTILGLRSGQRVLHWCPEGAPWGAAVPPAGGEVRLYDGASDPMETSDLAGAAQAEIERLRSFLERRVAELSARAPKGGFAAGEATMELLRRVGYVGHDD